MTIQKTKKTAEEKSKTLDVTDTSLRENALEVGRQAFNANETSNVKSKIPYDPDLSGESGCQTLNLKLVAAIPCRNTARTIAAVVRKTRQYVDEVIVIDDGSKDKTAKVARAAGAIVVSHGMNKGYGAAIKSCFKAARDNNADVLVIIDGDGQHNPDEIPALLAPIVNDGADLVIGSRFLDKSLLSLEGRGIQGEGDTARETLDVNCPSNVKSQIPYEQHESGHQTSNAHPIPRYRRFGISVINFLWNFGHKQKITDTQSGFRAYKKELFRNFELSENGMGLSIEILEYMRKQHPVVREVPINCSYENNNDRLTFKAFYHGLGVSLAVLKIRIKYLRRTSHVQPQTGAVHP